METNDILENEETVEATDVVEAVDETEVDVINVDATDADEAEVDVTDTDATDATDTTGATDADAVTEDATDTTSDEEPSEFQKVRERLEEIASIVDSDEISLDEALDLYEEAVVLGLQATDMLDIGITAQEEAQARMLGENPVETGAATTDAAVASVQPNATIPQTSEMNNSTEEQDATATDTEHVG